MEPPILAYPTFDGSKFILQTDASTTGLAYILSQIQNGSEKVIAYGGRSLNKAEKNYSITEMEALAVVEGVKKYSSYLLHGPQFQIVTDHQALCWLFSHKPTTGRLARWALLLQSYDYEIIHRKGKSITNVDSLSRIPQVEQDQPEKQSSVSSESNVSPILNEAREKPVSPNWTPFDFGTLDDCFIPCNSKPCVNATRNARYQKSKRVSDMQSEFIAQQVPSIHQNVNFAELKMAQKKDQFAGGIIAYLTNHNLPKDDKIARKLILEAENYFLHDDALYHIWHTSTKGHLPERTTVQLYIPHDYVEDILVEYHDRVLAAHFGIHKTYAKIRQRYFWRGMYKDIDNWIRSCYSCARRKTPKHKVIAPLMTMTVPDPFERLSVDILGPLPITSSGNKYVLCFTDHCTRWPILIPVKSIDAATIAKYFYKEIVCNHGCPRFLLSDRGSNFLSKLMLEVCRIMKTNKLNTSAYHPQCNAVQERFNAVILDTISHYVNQFHTDWDEYIPPIQFAYRTSPADNSVGFSPFFLLYGREAVLPLDVSLLKPHEEKEKTIREHLHHLVSQLETFRDVSKQHLQKNQAAMKERFDDHATNVEYLVGDCVFIYFPTSQIGLSKKLQQPWCGPYLLVKQTGPTNFMVRNLENNKLLSSPIHVNRMKFAYDRYRRPLSHVTPDELHRASIPDLSDADLPMDSFQPLLSKRDIRMDESLNVPGLLTPAPDEQEYEIERVVRGKFKNGKLNYLIKWKNFPARCNTWEPVEHLNTATLEYVKDHPVRITK